MTIRDINKYRRQMKYLINSTRDSIEILSKEKDYKSIDQKNKATFLLMKLVKEDMMFAFQMDHLIRRIESAKQLTQEYADTKLIDVIRDYDETG